MSFEKWLNQILGSREILHTMECGVCGFDEIYFVNPFTQKQIGRACEECQFVQRFEF